MAKKRFLNILGIKLNYWAILAIILFVVLWGLFTGFFPIFNNAPKPNLPTNPYLLDYGDDGKIAIQCLEGEAFSQRIVQGDILRCHVKLDSFNKNLIPDGLTISVVTFFSNGPNTVGVPISPQDMEKNGRWYSAHLNLSDLNTNEADFYIKVPPTESFFFFVDGVQNYFHDLQPKERWYSSTQFEEYLQSTLPEIQLLLLLFGVFGAVKYLRDLVENK